MTQGRGGWVEVSKKSPCCKCGKPDFCTRSADGLITKCMRASDGGRPIRQKDGSTAFLYATKEIGGIASPGRAKAQPPLIGKAELRTLIRQQQGNLTDRRLGVWASALGVSPKSLRAYGVGLDAPTGWAAFPMFDGTRDGKGKPNPCGVRLRDPESGKKLCVRGSRNGIFLPVDYDPAPIPAGLTDDPSPLLLLMPEGPTDCCAAFDLGFRAVGRPSNNGGMQQLRHLLSWGERQDVVIVADRDATKYQADGLPYWPGHEGAVALASDVLEWCARLRVVKPPKGTKDLRQWLGEGGTVAMFTALIGEAELVTAAWLKLRQEELYEWKKRLRRAAG